MASSSDKEVVAGLVREYLENPLETERRGILLDFLQDTSDYRYERLNHFNEVESRIKHYGHRIWERDTTLSGASQDSVNSFPLAAVCRRELRRPFLCSLFRHMPVSVVKPGLLPIGIRERKGSIHTSGIMIAWNWMRDHSANLVKLIHRDVVAGELLFSHLLTLGEFRELSRHLPGLGPVLSGDHYNTYSRQGRYEAADFNFKLWRMLRDLARCCSMPHFAASARDLNLDRTMANSQCNHSKNFNYNLWSLIYSVIPVPRTK